VAELSRDAELIVAVDGGAAICREAEVIPHILVGDMDSVAAAITEEVRVAGARIITHPAEKDETDLDLALALVADEGATAAVVTAAFSGRLDHTLAACGSLAKASCAALQVDYREPLERGWVLRADHGEVALTLRPAGAVVSVVALVGPAVVSARGTRWTLKRAALQPLASRGVSNVIVADEAHLIVHEGVVLVSNPGPVVAVGSRTGA
jgi:thiamine pyrophosphokinase